MPDVFLGSCPSELLATEGNDNGNGGDFSLHERPAHSAAVLWQTPQDEQPSEPLATAQAWAEPAWCGGRSTILAAPVVPTGRYSAV